MPHTAAPAQPTFVAFASGRLISHGHLADVAPAAKRAIDAGEPRAVQVFDATTSEPWDLDLSGSLDDVIARHRYQAPPDATLRDATSRDASSHETTSSNATAHATTPRAGPGRPKLGVVAREVTLLPRHWSWLNEQPGGASAAIRRLVEDARKSKAPQDVARRATNSLFRFLVATLGDAPGFEEAVRALYAGDETQFDLHSTEWPADLRTHAMSLAQAVFHPDAHTHPQPDRA